MTATASNTENLRMEAARIAFALIRFEGPAAHPPPSGSARVGSEAYVFLPSWRQVPADEVEMFFVGLPSPALLVPTPVRGVIALILLHELSGDRRRWAEKTLSNFALGLEETSAELGLSPTSRVLLEFPEESHVFSFAGVREWTQQFAVQVGWSIAPLESTERADACVMLRRSDGRRFPGQSGVHAPPGPERGTT